MSNSPSKTLLISRQEVIIMGYIVVCSQNDVNAHVILPGAHRSAMHMRRTFDTCFTLSLIIICMFYLSEFHTKQDLVLKYHILQLYLQW